MTHANVHIWFQIFYVKDFKMGTIHIFIYDQTLSLIPSMSKINDQESEDGNTYETFSGTEIFSPAKIKYSIEKWTLVASSGGLKVKFFVLHAQKLESDIQQQLAAWSTQFTVLKSSKL